MSDVADRVKKIVIEHLNVDAEKVTETVDLGTELLCQEVDLVLAAGQLLRHSIAVVADVLNEV
ncbi:MAG: hypothetical protein ACK6A4_18440, partial [Alphaproteobacteria bacterium]